MSKRKTDHIVLDGNIGGAFRCLNCGDTYLPALPMYVDDWLAVSKSFTKRHAGCKPQQAIPREGGV